jgi:hypothetical protein
VVAAVATPAAVVFMNERRENFPCRICPGLLYAMPASVELKSLVSALDY